MTTTKFIEFPSVYVLGRLALDFDTIKDYLDDHHTAWDSDLLDYPKLKGFPNRSLELASEFAGRVCYDAFGAAQYRKENQSYLDNILAQGHGSVLEHASVMLLITGVSRTLTHELVRHRVGVAYSQRSQRYVNEDNASFVVPPLILKNPPALLAWQQAMERAQEAYATFVTLLSEELHTLYPDMSARERRIQARQAARSLLPNATETQIVVTANLRALRHICEARGGLGAEAEIRRLACVLLDVMKVEAPNAFRDMQLATLGDGDTGVHVQHHKV